MSFLVIANIIIWSPELMTVFLFASITTLSLTIAPIIIVSGKF